MPRNLLSPLPLSPGYLFSSSFAPSLSYPPVFSLLPSRFFLFPLSLSVFLFCSVSPFLLFPRPLAMVVYLPSRHESTGVRHYASSFLPSLVPPPPLVSSLFRSFPLRGRCYSVSCRGRARSATNSPALRSCSRRTSSMNSYSLLVQSPGTVSPSANRFQNKTTFFYFTKLLPNKFLQQSNQQNRIS